MHKKHAAAGLQTVSVSTDPPEARDLALDFLKKKNATFPNYRIEEGPEVWQEKWKISAPPTVFVFDRKGRRAAKFSPEDEEYTPEDVENLVKKLLKEK